MNVFLVFAVCTFVLVNRYMPQQKTKYTFEICPTQVSFIEKFYLLFLSKEMHMKNE